MAYQAVLHKLPSEVISAHLEDVLTATVFGVIAYLPPSVARSFLKDVAGVPTANGAVAFDFWPQHRLDSARTVEPDVFVRLGREDAGALIIEAKQMDDPGSRQLLDEARAARATVIGLGPLHLLTVSDKSVAPRSHSRVKAPVGPYASTRHVSWGDLYRFLEQQGEDSRLDVGDQRLIADALAVLSKNQREPFKGMSRSLVRGRK